MHLLIIPVEELKEARELKEGLKTLLPEVLLLNASEGSLEFLRKKQEYRNQRNQGVTSSYQGTVKSSVDVIP